jgi:SAM-dependent methyltransferase
MLHSMDGETFARLFSAQYADFHDDLPLWLRLARQAGGPILEIGCGAGRVLRALASQGFDVTGVDTNPAMLHRAGAGLPEELRRRMQLVKQDLLALDLTQRFGLIVAPCNTLASLADSELARALPRLHAHLRPGGTLAFEVPATNQASEEVDSDEPLAAFVEPESGNPVQVYATQAAGEAGGRVVVTWRYDELLPDGGVRSWSLPTAFHLRQRRDFTTLLERAGFASAACYGGYALEPPGADDLQMIVVANA